MTTEENKGLYRTEFEHDACGIGFIANMDRKASHQLVLDGMSMLENMEHRGGTGIDAASGDGAGLLTEIPDEFFRSEGPRLGIELPARGEYGVAMIFFPQDKARRSICRNFLIDQLVKQGFNLLGFRRVPTENETLGKTPKSNEPIIEQLFVERRDDFVSNDALERKLYVLRRSVAHGLSRLHGFGDEDIYFCSCSSRTIIYKGQLTTDQVKAYYPDLRNPKYKSSLVLLHSRFSTNTFPKWHLAHPFRYIAHNGEINTIKGNVNWMLSNQTLLESTLFDKEEIEHLLPVVNHANSDSSNLDNVIELFVQGGRSIPHAMMMLIPEAWRDNPDMTSAKEDFYKYHASLMEPWDGPASICFTDGKVVGATLDRNGLRPSRYCVTKDRRVILSSEGGALRVEQSNILRKGRLEPGKMLVVDLEQNRIVEDAEIKNEIATRRPYGEWIKANELHIDELPETAEEKPIYSKENLFKLQKIFGYSVEDLNVHIAELIANGKEPLGSMGMDTPLAILSTRAQHLSNYFKQHFAQVSNPPIDPIRERLVMSLYSSIGRSFNLLSETPAHSKMITLPQPILSNEQLEKVRHIQHTNFRTKTLDAVFKSDGQPGRLEEALDAICKEADHGIIDEGMNVILISDRKVDREHAPIPSLLAVGAIHQHLIRKGTRVRVGIVVEAGDVVETHHYATLIGYGANAINPYVALDTVRNLLEQDLLVKDNYDQVESAYIDGIGKGLLKIFSKMGISTLQSYHGSQIFEALGIGKKVVDRCFTGTVSRIGGLDFDGIATEVLAKHRLAYGDRGLINNLSIGGIYQWKRQGEKHLFTPDTIHLLQQASWKNDQAQYKKYAQLINEAAERETPITLRNLLRFKDRKAINIREVEPAENIMKRFATGAMSFGSISWEAHTTLAIAMNRIGGKSNSGEGGEDPRRYEPLENGDSMRSAIKQIASGRFGVTSHYLTQADELQIKMAQGAKPGEGGQLPGHKVDDWIGRTRHSTPGVGLISPPPHHDIYSIEDLAQLIFDLKNANPASRINVKLVSKAGVGTIAAGVAKAKGEAILISGYDGGTGASPWSSIRHAGLPWEMGLAEAQQTLVKNGLRNRVVLQTDGQIRTGRDLAIATLLGAEEWGVATAALVVEGCIMMRKCHKNTCPVGIATQNPELRKKFKGNPDHVVNFFRFMAEELREIMASLGFRTVNEMVGRSDILEQRKELKHWKLQSLELESLYHFPEARNQEARYHNRSQEHGLEQTLDHQLIQAALPAIHEGRKVTAEFGIHNTDRATGTQTSCIISKQHGQIGLEPGSIQFKFKGSAGQSFGAFGARGLEMILEGGANDYFGKGLSGAQLAIYPQKEASFKPSENSIIGNVALYGATSGKVYINGMAGERFAVRNSGADAVVEGIGAHGCEYMTGGRVVILGGIGRNFAAGMSGGMAFLYNSDALIQKYLNPELVLVESPDEEDLDWIKTMIQNHLKYTGSPKAKKLLEHWDDNKQAFTKVIPVDYKRILEAQKTAVGAESK